MIAQQKKNGRSRKSRSRLFIICFACFSMFFAQQKGSAASIWDFLFCFLFLRPLIAEIWGRYISVVENAGNRVTEAALMLVLYWGISFAADLLESYLAPEGGGDFEQLDMIQANRQQELFKVHLLKKVNSVSPEYLEAPVG